VGIRCSHALGRPIVGEDVSMTSTPVTTLSAQNALALLRTAVDNVRRDHPVHWTHVISGDEELRPQRERHPAFAGSFDWHSCVHQTWLIVRLRRLLPSLPLDGGEALDALLTPENCQVEADFFASDLGRHWERPYGWAWLLTLDAELRLADFRWASALRPLADVLRRRWLEWITAARLPVRVGSHSNTAYAAGMVLDVARALGDEELAASCVEAARRWYLGDVAYGAYEPDAYDFLSPALIEADLMRRVLPAGEFSSWFDGFLPDLEAPRWASLREPVVVDDPRDAYQSHLAGLALSRAWCWRNLAPVLPSRFSAPAVEAFERHRTAGWSYVFGNGYGADHWLGTFAAYLDLGALDAGPKQS
jgi:Zn-dependent protease